MKIGKTRLEVTGENITDLDVEGIVNPANDMLWMGGGVSAEIRRAGGDSIEKEALEKAPSDIGEVVITDAGTLKARWILHAVISGQDLITSEDSIRKAVTACLSKTNEVGCKSLAIPVLTTGIHDIEVHIDIYCIVNEIVDYLVNEKHPLEYIAFVGSTEETRKILNSTLLEKFTKHG